MKTDFRYSQNFLYSPKLVRRLVSQTNITRQDLVYDIGSGRGIITHALAQAARTVIAIELDQNLANLLKERFRPQRNVIVYAGNFMDVPLPQTSYKVFANIPFNMSSAIIGKLFNAPNPPEACYLIVQKQFADKLLARRDNRSRRLTGQFQIQIIATLYPENFYPRPRVVSVLLSISR